MTRRVPTTLCAAALLALLPLSALAQARHWVQVEAHPTLRTAEEWAARYEADFGNVAGFRLAGGWYALALGPFETAADAAAVRQRLLDDRMIPRDAYLTQDSDYRQQFWPMGAAAAEPAEAPAPSHATSERAPEPARVAEPVAASEPELAEAPGESLAQARANEARLTRADRADIQTALQFFGHYTMAVDASFGPGTRRAIGDWQEARGDAATGYLTTEQRATLLGAHSEALARFGFEAWRDTEAGIEIELPLGLVAFDRRESPFVHFDPIEDSGLRILLISQDGSQAALSSLFEVMQTLDAIPLDGERSRSGNGFVLTGQSDTARAHATASLQGGKIKGWALFWEPRADAEAERVLAAMETSFRAIDGVLDDGFGAPASAVARRDLLAGMELRRPIRARSGFFVDDQGTVATTAEAVQGCGRITIDSAYDAEVRYQDEAAGIAILSPVELLVPLDFARFSPNGARLDAVVRVAGFSYAETLTRPVLTRGQITDLSGLNGEPMLKRLAIRVEEGDSGGPVFNGYGAVVGMLLPRRDDPARLLPEDVNFAVSAEAVLGSLQEAGLKGAVSRENGSVPPETLTHISADLTVLVSCWD